MGKARKQTHKRKRKEVVTARRIRRELTSERFLRGLEKAIEITYQTGREASFEMDKVFGERWLTYPLEIDIGTPGEVGKRTSFEIAKNAQARYEEETGITLSERMTESANALEEWRKFMIWQEERNAHTSVEYPDVSRLMNLRGSATILEYSFNFPHFRRYKFLDFHTHPCTNEDMFLAFQPSLEDLQALNNERMRNRKEVGVALSPIFATAIVNTEGPLKATPIMFYQEKSQQPLDEERMREAKSKFIWLSEHWYGKSPEEKLVATIFSSASYREIEKTKADLPYNFVVSYFYWRTKKLGVDKRFNQFEIRA